MCLVLAFSSSNTDEDADVLVSIATDVPLPPLKAAGKGLPVAYLEMDNDFSRGQARKALDHFGDRVTWARMDEGRRGPQNEAMAKPSGAVGAFLHSQRDAVETLTLSGDPGQRLFIYSPVGEADREALVAALRASGSVFAEDELAALTAASSGEDLAGLVARRVAGEPLQYVLGYAEFAGLRLVAREGVFIPRPRTELLARLAARRLGAGGSLLDLGCGVGPVSAYVASQGGRVGVVAVDVSPRALEVARENLPAGALLVRAGEPEALDGSFDVIAANLPYVPTDAIALMPFEAREREPRASLDGGPDGLDPLRTWARGLPRLLAPGGSFFVEVSAGQVPLAEAILASSLPAGRVAVHTDADLDATVVETRQAELRVRRPGESPRLSRALDR